jgi:hypothetical protein
MKLILAVPKAKKLTARRKAAALRVPVRDDVGELLLLLEVGHQGLSALRGGGGVDAAVGGLDEQDQVRLSAELLVDDLRGPGGLGGGVVEAASVELFECAGSQHAHEGHGHDGDDEDQPGPANRKFGQAFKHVRSPLRSYGGSGVGQPDVRRSRRSAPARPLGP